MSTLDRLLSLVGLQRVFPNPTDPRARLRGYSMGRIGRLTADWKIGETTEDWEVYTSLSQLRARSRDLCRDDDFAKSFLRLLAANVPGPMGFKLVSDVTDVDPQGNYVPDTKANDILETAFADFSQPENFTVTGELSRRAFEHLAVQSVARDGETFVRLVRSAEYKYGLALQPFEGDQVDHLLNRALSGDRFIRMGIEFDGFRKPQAYWMSRLTSSSDSDFYFPGISTRHIRLPAEDIIHLHLPMYFCGTRGVPWFHTAGRVMHQLWQYTQSEVISSRLASNKLLYFTHTVGSSPKPYTGDSTSDAGRPQLTVEPGQIEDLAEGVEPKAIDWRHPHTEFGDFQKPLLRRIGSGLGVSYAALANDVSDASYSSIRAGTADEREFYKLLQAWFIESLLRRVYSEWLKMYLLTGKSGLPASKLEKFNSPCFVGRRWGYVNPVDEQNAATMAVALRTKTRTQICAEQGDVFEDVLRQVKREEELAKKYGVNLDQPRPGMIPPSKEPDEPAQPPAKPAPPEPPEDDE